MVNLGYGDQVHNESQSVNLMVGMICIPTIIKSEEERMKPTFIFLGLINHQKQHNVCL